ncbi:DUF7287 family protein [Haloarchaeobius sp. TZWWS8]|uniref:DUF7287 family protein n=1 Tax=Haloarchaeobius sp. TZWWS8 TaxID=3446121 RepID=UPI003EBFC0C0
MTMKSVGNTLSDGRGQTTQDFAVGISIFLLAVGFTFGFFPSLLTPFGSPLGDDITAKSDRVAATLIEEHHVDGEPRRLDYAQLNAFLADNDTASELRDHFGLRSSANVNVTLQDVQSNGTRTQLLSAGDVYADQTPAASTTRVVVVTGGQCTVECLVIVRVW